jgi:predicted phosphohydrolase
MKALHKWLEKAGGAKDDWVSTSFKLVEGYEVTILHVRNDQLQLVRALVGNPAMQSNFILDAYQTFNENGERVLDGEFMNARFATETQSRLPQGFKHIVVGTMVDKTNVTDHFDLFPLYMVCHNYDLSVKFKFKNVALVALIPILKQSSYIRPSEKQYHQWRVVQEAQRLVLKARMIVF